MGPLLVALASHFFKRDEQFEVAEALATGIAADVVLVTEFADALGVGDEGKFALRIADIE